MIKHWKILCQLSQSYQSSFCQSSVLEVMKTRKLFVGSGWSGYPYIVLWCFMCFFQAPLVFCKELPGSECSKALDWNHPKKGVPLLNLQLWWLAQVLDITYPKNHWTLQKRGTAEPVFRRVRLSISIYSQWLQIPWFLGCNHSHQLDVCLHFLRILFTPPQKLRNCRLSHPQWAGWIMGSPAKLQVLAG